MSSKAKHAARSRKTYRAKMNAARGALSYFAVSNRIRAAKQQGGFLANLFRRKVPNE